MRYLLFGAALLAGACASAASNGVTCGPGTVLEDDQCVPAPTGDAGEGPVAEAGGPPPKAGSSDGGPDEVDAGPPIHIGDPCDPLQQNGACYGKLAFTCSPGVTLDAGVFEQLDDCSLMGGDCIPAQAGFAGAHCVGGGYTSCNPLTDLGHCHSAGVLAKCQSTSLYKSTNCARTGLTCVETDAGASCR